MIVVFGFLIAGILAGFLLRRKQKLIQLADRLTTWFIYLFLLLLGISVGANQIIMNNFAKLGGQAIIISIGAVIGSLIVANLVYLLVFKKKENEE